MAIFGLECGAPSLIWHFGYQKIKALVVKSCRWPIMAAGLFCLIMPNRRIARRCRQFTEIMLKHLLNSIRIDPQSDVIPGTGTRIFRWPEKITLLSCSINTLPANGTR